MILDTCALLWLANANPRLGRVALKKIQEAPELWVSAISAFEIALKVAKGKLELPVPSEEWFATVVEHHGISVAPLDAQVCVRAAELPRIHDDPCDRFIIATAKLNDWEVLTEDERFAAYGVSIVTAN